MDDMLFLCDPDTGICGMEVKQKGPSWRGYEAGAVRSSQSGQMKEADWLNPQAIDQRQLFNGNSVLRGQTPGIESIRDYALIE